MAAAQRFLGGVHPRSECGSNKSSYAAVGAASHFSDLHSIDSYPCNASTQSAKHIRKRSVSSNDTMSYLCIKLSQTNIDPQLYILLSFGNHASFGAVNAFISGISSQGKYVITLSESNGLFDLSLHHLRKCSSHSTSSLSEILSILSIVSPMRNTTIITSPIVSDNWISVINSVNPTVWCVPASPRDIWVSVAGRQYYSHFILPWSKFPTYVGYTIGHGSIQKGGPNEKLRYEARATFYNNMISCAPLDGSCVDCIAMRQVGEILSTLSPTQHPRAPRQLSESSIEALEEIRKSIVELTG
jgi:hypothetical protein